MGVKKKHQTPNRYCERLQGCAKITKSEDAKIKTYNCTATMETRLGLSRLKPQNWRHFASTKFIAVPQE